MIERWNNLLGVGVNPHDMTLLQMSLRAIVIFAVALCLIRFADKRFLANKTGFDVLLVFVLGSTLSRAINGAAPLLGTIFVGFIVVLLHRILAALAYRSYWLCALLKGTSDKVIVDGELKEDIMRKHHLTEADIKEDMRLKTNVWDFSQVREARIERNGEISVIAKPENNGSNYDNGLR